ncbi:hypothetical protein [Thermoanaerobacterium thermosaccharolyticum]|uniref:Uncharacterized protein n=1 Tax=Thermoanaerobacterium thermosaccharolyticum M0795 TaxID=698948 RepID=L0IMH2_THETR|nr:hypothetical protein [Thermoanaerobacterium thermosaccharolyticum]AGB19959.1 hypothetical protein Thethe_02389 [Thermoanaerobacterium thermosaccharolyticum M0795]
MELKRKLLKVVGILFIIIGLFCIIAIIKSIVSMDIELFANISNIIDVIATLLFLYVGYIFLRYSQ